MKVNGDLVVLILVILNLCVTGINAVIVTRNKRREY